MAEFSFDLNIFVLALNPLARVGLLALLAQQEGGQVVGDAATSADLLDQLDEIDVILWDFTWNMEGASADLQALIQEEISPPVVAILADETDAPFIQAAGASGLLSQGSTSEQIYAALFAAYHGLTVLDPEFNLIPPPSQPSDAILTSRELEVLQQLAQGSPNKAIARQLGVSDHTVKFHVNAIMTKLEAQSRTEAVVKGMKLGLVIL